MKTGLSKKQKATNIYFNEADSMIEVCTYNTATAIAYEKTRRKEEIVIEM